MTGFLFLLVLFEYYKLIQFLTEKGREIQYEKYF